MLEELERVRIAGVEFLEVKKKKRFMWFLGLTTHLSTRLCSPHQNFG
jgi:hypothetical protein